MDDRLKKALEFSKYQKTFQLKKDTLRIRLNNQLIYKYNNHIFTINKELIVFLSINTRCIIEDINGVPVLIENPKETYFEMLEIYNTAYQEYYNEYNKIKTSRNIKKIVDYK